MIRHQFVFTKIFIDARNTKFIPSIILDEYEDKILISTFKSYTNRSGYYNYCLSSKKHPGLALPLFFNGNIFLTTKDKIVYPSFFVELNEEEIKDFIKKLGLIDLNNMSKEDFDAFINFTAKYNKDIVCQGAVIPSILDKSGKLSTYYIERILNSGMICIPLYYEKDEGLKVKSRMREFVPYDIYITGVYYLKEQEERINEMLESPSLKLK